MKNQNSKVLFLAQAAMIAAIYVVLTVLGASLAFGEVQIRFAEALTILPVFTPAAIPGLFIGCLLGNICLLYTSFEVLERFQNETNTTLRSQNKPKKRCTLLLKVPKQINTACIYRKLIL